MVLIIAYVTQNIPKKIPIAFHNRANYGYRFIIKDLLEEFEK